MQSTENTPFVSIHLPEPNRIQVIHLAHLVFLDVRPEAGTATANLSDGSQVRGTMHQMWPLLEIVGLQASQVEMPAIPDSDEDQAEDEEGAWQALIARVEAEAADQHDLEELEDVRCQSEFDLEMAHFHAQVEDERIAEAAHDLAQEEEATARLRDDHEFGWLKAA